MNTATEPVMCPSHRCKTGSELLGVRQDDGTIALFPQTLPVDEEFVEKAQRHGKPEERFRFTNKCIEGGCKQWTGKACGVAERVVQFLDRVQAAPLPPCGIRPRCRWHRQAGDEACRICPYIVTEITEEEIRGHGANYFNEQAANRMAAII